MRGPDGIKNKFENKMRAKSVWGDEAGGGVLKWENCNRGQHILGHLLSLLSIFPLHFSVLSKRAHGGFGLRSWIFYAIALCIKAFHMTSVVISLYFKQENCETLISQYNWGQMKLCQSELVLHKVERFCSRAVCSRWPGFSLFFTLSCSVLSSALIAFCFNF